MHFYTFQPGQDVSSPESPSNSLRKEANWLRFVTLRAERDPQQEKMWTQLQQRKVVDELLRVQAHFIKVTSADVSISVVYQNDQCRCEYICCFSPQVCVSIFTVVMESYELD